MSQPLFDANAYDPHAAGVARDKSIRVVDEHAAPDWKIEARRVVRHLAETKPEFTTDPVWFMLERFTEAETHEPRALGAVMRAAARDRLIVATDRTVESVRVANHRRPVRIWKSLVYTGNGFA